MSTKPILGLLNREVALKLCERDRNAMSDILSEVANKGTEILSKCSVLPIKIPESYEILLFYRHILEILDAVEVQIANSVIDPIIIQLRSAFEALLSMDYIAETDTARRANAFFYFQQLERIKFLKMYQPHSKERKAIISDLKKRNKEYIKHIKLTEFPDAEQKIHEIETILEKPEFVVIAREIEQIKQKAIASGRTIKPRWYSVFSKCTSIEILARHLGRIAEYEFLYRPWSKVAHSENVLSYVEITSKGEECFRCLRNAENLYEYFIFALNIFFDSSEIMMKVFKPDDIAEFDRWRGKEIMPFLKLKYADS